MTATVKAVSRSVAERERVLTGAVAEVARRLELGSADFARIIGGSQPTASRLLNGKVFLRDGSKEWELSTHLVRLYRSLSSVVGGSDELARAWLQSPNRAFQEQMPLTAIKRIDGLLYACEYLDAHRASV